jgi:hypothetical protein
MKIYVNIQNPINYKMRRGAYNLNLLIKEGRLFIKRVTKYNGIIKVKKLIY